jgi:GNAT superfamily N-acetyltransferase
MTPAADQSFTGNEPEESPPADIRWMTESLGRHHDRSVFSSGVEPLDRYLKTQANQDARRHVAAPFVSTDIGMRNVIGYYTLSTTGVDLETLPQTEIRKLPRYPIVPSVLLGRLAIDERYRGKKLGRFLLLDAMNRSLRIEIAWLLFVVEAKDRAACEFYERYGLTPFDDRTNQLFIHRQKIEHLLMG